MPDALFVILLPVVILCFAGIAITLLVWPSKFLRHFANSLEPDTLETRVQMRGLGLVFSLLVSQFILAAAPPSPLLEKFRHNMLIALWVSPIAVPIFLWILWLAAVRSFLRRAQIEGISENPRWERRMTLVFCTVFLLVIMIALFLAAK